MNMMRMTTQTRKPNTILLLAMSLVLLLILAACGASAPAPDQTQQNAQTATENGTPGAAAPLLNEGVGTSEEAYPAATAVPEEPADPTGSYPPAASPTPLPTATMPAEYPAVEPAEQFLEPRFRLDLPLEPGATLVTGQAPPGLALIVADVTYNGEVLGSGAAGDDARFSIEVAPLRPGNRVGITFGEIEEGLSLVDMAEKYYLYRGEGFVNLPNVGIFYDSALVNE